MGKAHHPEQKMPVGLMLLRLRSISAFFAVYFSFCNLLSLLGQSIH